MMVEEHWTDDVCKAVGVSAVGKASRTFTASEVALSEVSKQFLIRKGDAVGLTDFHTDIRGNVVEYEAAFWVDIRFLSGDEVITARAPKGSVDSIREVPNE
jgi:acetylornithine deacetylase/succinyl-diaminopimelate desuccinylase-like protein